VHVLYLAKSPPRFLHDLHLFERSLQRIGSGAYRLHHSFPRSIGGRPCFLAGAAASVNNPVGATVNRMAWQSDMLPGRT
jgi:hypothetical protein